MIGRAWLAPGAAVALLIASAAAGAQRPIPQPTRPGVTVDTVRRPVARDTTRRDSTARDSAARDSLRRDTLGIRDTTGRRPLVEWRLSNDSIANSLLQRPGYRVTQYQGSRVIFNAETKALTIEGKPAAVGREQTTVVGDTVLYNDSTHLVTALGDTVILRDTSQQQADIVARGRVTYNAALGRGTVTNIATSVESGQQYFVSGKEATFVRDTTRAQRNAYYIRNGIITSCDDTVPDYYFKANEVKYVSKNLLVARPATLYIAGVPVFWLPFLFQDVRHGRRSGILTPRFGFSEFVRNSSSYRRHVENVGYYANLGDYMDAQAWVDWRSSARGTESDPGYLKVNGEFRYRWLDRFITGGLSANHLDQRNGQSNTAVSWFHSQEFSSTSRLYADINFVTNTTVQRTTTFDPRAVLATIRSDARYSRKIGPFSVDLGGNREQYPGRPEVLENYPNLNLTSPTLELAPWLEWTPTLSYSRSARKNTDEAGTFTYRYFTNASGAPDSTRIPGNTRNDQMSFSTPFVIHGFSLQLNGRYANVENNYPLIRTFVDPADTTQRITRTYARSYTQTADWSAMFSLPTLLSNSIRLQPGISFNNVMGGDYFVRTELSNGQWVHQSKRPNFSLSISPTLFAFFPGIGPLERIRHEIQPTISYGYSPAGHISDEYLRALNRNPGNFLGNLPTNTVTLRLSQTFEGKFRSDTGASAEGKKVKLLSIDMSSFTYDFERARVTHRTGLTTDRFDYTLSSDLLPGFSFRSGYSLFQGDIQSDSARFKPFRTDIGAQFTINGQSGIFAALNRLFGRAVPRSAPEMQNLQQPSEDQAMTDRLASLPVAGSYARDRQYQIPETETWQTAITFNSERQRPPVGGRVIDYDPAAVCAQYASNPPIYDTCKQNALLNPQTTVPINDPIAGGVFVRMPATETLNAQTTFHITPKWSANWGTMYDMVHNQFASNTVSLQRDLHDWRALFSFSQNPNGNFYFSFFIANKAQPDLKFNYDKPTYRQQDLR